MIRIPPYVKFPTSDVVVSTLQTPLSWETLSVEHCRHGRGAKGQKCRGASVRVSPIKTEFTDQAPQPQPLLRPTKWLLGLSERAEMSSAHLAFEPNHLLPQPNR